jgi:integrase
MACIRKRRNRWVLDYRDGAGRRRWESFRTKGQAEEAFARVVPASRERQVPAVHSGVTLAEYAGRWLGLCAGLKPRTVQGYREKLKLHILPALGTFKVRKIHRSVIKSLLAEKQSSGLSVETVRLIHATLRAMLNAAVEDEVIRANPAANLGRVMRLARSPAERRERIRALDADQLSRFLGSTAEKVSHLYPLFFLLSRTGLRLGEALALEWSDADLEKRDLRVERAVSTSGEVSTPKSGHGRTVDLSASATDVLRTLRARMKEAALRRGGPPPSRMFVGKQEKPIPHVTAEAGFKRALKGAGLPDRFSPHSLRHTYASLLLANGTSPAYVQDQLGHSSIELTVGTYGRWLRKRAPGALECLDSTEVVAEEPKTVAVGPVEGDGQPPPEGAKSTVFRGLAERGGFEPPVEVYPLQQISNLPCSATPAPLRSWRPGPGRDGSSGQARVG